MIARRPDGGHACSELELAVEDHVLQLELLLDLEAADLRNELDVFVAECDGGTGLVPRSSRILSSPVSKVPDVAPLAVELRVGRLPDLAMPPSPRRAVTS